MHVFLCIQTSKAEVREIIDRGDMIPDTMVGLHLVAAATQRGDSSCWHLGGLAINSLSFLGTPQVGDLLLEALLVHSCKSKEQVLGATSECGVLVDGFPRTAVQVIEWWGWCEVLSPGHSAWAASGPHGCRTQALSWHACFQVDFLKLLYDKLQELHSRFSDTPVLAPLFPRPLFKVQVFLAMRSLLSSAVSLHRQY
jgi:hypothetical protein